MAKIVIKRGDRSEAVKLIQDRLGVWLTAYSELRRKSIYSNGSTRTVCLLTECSER